MRHLLLIISVLFLVSMPLCSDEPLHISFYGVFSPSIDKSMLDMTKNLYFTQLQEMDNVSVTDKSSSISPEDSEKFYTDTFNPSTVGGHPDAGIVFFAEIKEQSPNSGTWTCTLNARNLETGKKVSVSKQYDSYYKILTEAKSSIKELLDTFQLKKSSTADSSSSVQPETAHTSTESIAGTWYGEEYIDKIVILRGGRGFIIYKNGAAMNITVSVKNSDAAPSLITIQQAGKSNASFFPELPRKTALDNAASAPPIKWQLTLISSDELTGSKQTLIADPASTSGAVAGTETVTWKRR